MSEHLQALAERLGEVLKGRGMMLATAESCTGGWVGKVVTDITGSSSWFDRGFVVYNGQAKQDMLGVHAETLQAHGEVSEETVREMADGALTRSQAGVAVAVSGIAGPSGGTPFKPVGTVCFAWARRDGTLHSATMHFSGERSAVREQAVAQALQGVVDMLVHDDE